MKKNERIVVYFSVNHARNKQYLQTKIAKLAQKHNLETEDISLTGLINDGINWEATYQITTQPFNQPHSQKIGAFIDEVFQMNGLSPSFTENPYAPLMKKPTRSVTRRA